MYIYFLGGFFSLFFWMYWIENYFILGKALIRVENFFLDSLLNYELKRFWIHGWSWDLCELSLKKLLNISVLGGASVKGIGKQWIERVKLERNWGILYRKEVRDLWQYGNFITEEKFYFKETLREDFTSWISWKAIIYKLLLM